MIRWLTAFVDQALMAALALAALAALSDPYTSWSW